MPFDKILTASPVSYGILLSMVKANVPMWYPWSDVKMTYVLSRMFSDWSLAMTDSTMSSTDSRVRHRFRYTSST